MTTNSHALVQRLIANDGRIGKLAPDNPSAIKIVEYENAWGGICWGIVFEGQPPYGYQDETDYIRHPRVIWEKGVSS